MLGLAVVKNSYYSVLMKTLSEATFKALAGDDVYERGLAYYNQGRVGALTISNNRISANVEGSHSYSVELQHTAKFFEGSCNCPASDNFDFCKHCVAASLAYYYQTQTNAELADADQDDRLQNYLATLTKPELVEELHKLVLRDSDILDHWHLKAEIASGSLGVPEIRKRITKAIPYKPSGLWRYREVAEYFEQAERALSVLHEPISALEPNDSIKLIVYSAQRLEKTLESVDDSGGYRVGLEERITAWFDALFSSIKWNSKQKANWIIKLLFDDKYKYELFDLPHSVSEHLDDKALKSIYQEIEKNWYKLEPDNEAYSDAHYHYRRLENLLVAHAREQNNLRHEFKILERGAIDVPGCLTLVDRCIENELLEDGEKWLSYSTQISQPDARELYQIESAQIELFKAQKKYAQALEIQWSRFEEQEDLEQFNEALKTANKIQQKQIWLDKGIIYIKDKLVKRDNSQKNRQRAELLTDIYLTNGFIKEAINMSKHYFLRPQTLMTIVNASIEINNKTFRLIEEATNRLLFTANNHIYDEAIKFLEQQFNRLNAQYPNEFKAQVLRIYNEPSNKRKINFVKRLKSAFPDYF